MPKRVPDIRPAEWIRHVLGSLKAGPDKVGQERFAELVGAEGGRDTVAKWIGKNPQEPGFTYTRRIVLVAPPHLVATFIGRPVLRPGEPENQPLDERPGFSESKRGGGREERAVLSDEARYIAARLDEIADDDVRASAMEACSAALRKILHPSELDAESRPGRAQRK